MCVTSDASFQVDTGTSEHECVTWEDVSEAALYTCACPDSLGLGWPRGLQLRVRCS